MKKIIVLFIFLMSMTTASAVEYFSVGSNAKFCVYTFDNEYFLILSFKDDDENRLTDNTIVKFKLADGSVLVLSGSDGSRSTRHSSVHWGFGIASGSSSDEHYAILYVTPEDMELLKQGVDKVAINTIPECYKRSRWAGKSDFGIGLYDEFKKMKNEFDE